MAAPTTAEIRAWSKVDFADAEYPAPTGSNPDPLDIERNRAIEYVEWCTGRSWAEPASIPTTLTQTMAEAAQRRVEQLVFAGNQDAAETAGDIDMIQSFSAGSYSESRVNDVRATGKASHTINSWPLLNDLLWRATTEAKKEEWRELWGEIVPASSVTEVDWEYPDWINDIADEKLAE